MVSDKPKRRWPFSPNNKNSKARVAAEVKQRGSLGGLSPVPVMGGAMKSAMNSSRYYQSNTDNKKVVIDWKKFNNKDLDKNK